MWVDILCGEAVLGVLLPFAVEKLILLFEPVVEWVAPLALLAGRASSREVIDVAAVRPPASKRARALLLGESERDAISGWLLDVLACLDGVPEGRGGTGFDGDVLLTVATEGDRWRDRSGIGGEGAALVGLAVTGRGGYAWLGKSSNTEVAGEANGDMA